MKTKIPESVLNFLRENGTVVNVVDGNKEYLYLPFWFEVIDGDRSIVVFHDFEKLPKDLRDIINDERI